MKSDKVDGNYIFEIDEELVLYDIVKNLPLVV
jgi:hypothetical protein